MELRLSEIVGALSHALDVTHGQPGGHAARSCLIGMRIAHAVDLDADDLRTLRRAGLLHDLGKLAISNRILDKPGKLTDDEWAVVREHPALSERILAGVPAFAAIARIAGNHHERVDGSGYPHGRIGLGLEPLSRILCVADVAEALSADRPYRGPLDPETVLEIMRRDAGTKLDATALAALEDYLPERQVPQTLAAVAA
jgi:HD-GYP domain-containing protein (c-di-GMP phosphodiesterase class II)